MQSDRPDRFGRWFPVEDHEDLPQHVRDRGAFLPRPLPSEVHLRMETSRVLADAQEALGRLDAAVRQLRDPAPLIDLIERREVQAAANWAGLIATLEEVFLIDVPGVVVPAADERLQRLLQAVRFAVTNAKRNYPVDNAILVQFSSITSDVPAKEGVQLRDAHRLLGSFSPRDAVLLASPPGPELGVATAQLLSWMEFEQDMPIVCKIALGIYQLMLLAPTAGSDQLALLWPNLELIRRGILSDHLLPLIDWLRRERVELYQQVRDTIVREEYNDFIVFIAAGIQVACRQQLTQIEQLKSVTDELRQPFPPRRDLIAELISSLPGSPVTNNAQVAQRLGVSTRHARTLTQKLEEAGVLQRLEGSSSGNIFSCRRIMQVLRLYHKNAPDNDRDVVRK